MAAWMDDDERPNNVSFGTTMDRQIFPMKIPPTKFATELNPITGQPNTGPGRYEVEEKTNFIHTWNQRPISNKGYVFGARTDKRFKDIISLFPEPGAYDHSMEPHRFCSSYRPFNQTCGRFDVPKSYLDGLAPGPGTYESDIKRTRKVTLAQAFGGTPAGLPCITQHSTIDSNTDKLRSTTEERKYHRKLAYLKLYYD